MMDVNDAPVHNAKTQKLKEEWNMDERRNRIDNLPDVILEHILSLLPIKCAARTSILSKRWQCLWMSVPDLDFRLGEGGAEWRTPFMNFVERLVLLRDSNIRKFILSFGVQRDASRVNSWVSAAVRHKVEELDLSLFDLQEPFELPSSVFNCDSLTILRLSLMQWDLKFPSSICFSNLKILNLTHVVFPDDYSTQQLFSGCPVLEELCLIVCRWANIRSVSISAPMLKKLSISDIDYVINSNNCQVMIFGTNLKSFLYEGELTNDYCLYNLTSLVDAEINMHVTSREVAYRAHKLFTGLYNVKSLTISSETIVVLSETEELLAHLPAFNNLTSLKLNDPPVNFYNGALLNILRNSPRLSSLEFTGGLWSDRQDEWMFDWMPSCFITHLKTIKISDFYGNKDELQVLNILVKNGMVLEKIIIYCNTHVFERMGYSWYQKVIYEQLLSFPRGSMGCEIVLS